jgi:hypothetical protein
LRKFHFIFIIIFFSWAFHLNAQTSTGHNLAERRLISYFESLRESAFLHLNKTAFVPGEEVWFKAYVYDRKNQIPFKETTNLNIAIYDSLGKQIDRKLIYVNNGYGSGSIKIDSSFHAGKYYLKASTNWMKNFKEDDSFTQEIHVLKNNVKLSPQIKSVEYDVQFLPEGGNLIVNAINTIGVKVINNNGRGADIKEGVVRDDKGKMVTEFFTTKYGLGKFLYKPREGVNYYAEILFENDTKKKFKLPKSLSEGVTIALEQKDEDEIIIFLSTNKNSLDKLQNKKFALLVHRDGILKKIDVNFNRVDTTYAFVIEKDFLLEGMNILTLIDDQGKPILERLYFNFNKKSFPNVNVKFIEKEFDSLVFEVHTKADYKNTKNLSFSVLPSARFAYRQNQNIRSAFNLKPYVKGNIENPAYYFVNFDDGKEKELDLLLLTQGWSRYEWRDLNSPPGERYEFEHGIDLRGRINMKVNFDDKVILFPTKKHATIMENLDQNSFKILDLILLKGESLNFSLLKKNNKLVKPKLYLKTQDKYTEDLLEIDYPTIVSPGKKVDIKSFNFKNFLYDGAVELDEVFLIGNKKKKAESNIYVSSYLKDKVTEVTEDIAFSFQYITDVIKSRGYDVRLGLMGASFDRVSIRVKYNQSLLGRAELTSPEPIIYLNDQRLVNFDVLYNALTADFEGYYFQRSGASEGVRGGGGVIRLYSKRESNKSENSNRPAQSSEYIVKNGFEFSKKFYTPKYQSYEDPAFKRYGTIHWDPDLKIKQNEKVRFRIFNTGIKNLTFYYQGMGENGGLISGKQEISLN